MNVTISQHFFKTLRYNLAKYKKILIFQNSWLKAEKAENTKDPT